MCILLTFYIKGSNYLQLTTPTSDFNFHYRDGYWWCISEVPRHLTSGIEVTFSSNLNVYEYTQWIFIQCRAWIYYKSIVKHIYNRACWLTNYCGLFYGSYISSVAIVLLSFDNYCAVCVQQGGPLTPAFVAGSFIFACKIFSVLFFFALTRVMLE